MEDLTRLATHQGVELGPQLVVGTRAVVLVDHNLLPEETLEDEHPDDPVGLRGRVVAPLPVKAIPFPSASRYYLLAKFAPLYLPSALILQFKWLVALSQSSSLFLAMPKVIDYQGWRV